MIKSQKPELELNEVQQWLDGQYQVSVDNLAPISGGFWSAAYGFKVGGEPFVLRLSHDNEGFLIDQQAMKFIDYQIPVPEIISLGQWQDRFFAISRRHFGEFLEQVPVSQSESASQALAAFLRAMRSVPAQPDEPVNWFVNDQTRQDTWHRWLLAGLTDEENAGTHGWRKKVAGNPKLKAILDECEDRIQMLLPLCPERRDLIHGDLLHQNILLTPDASAVTAAFSWKCSARGDFLYDVAWCTLWGNWFAGIAACDVWAQTWRAPDMTEEMLLHAPERHHCYELHIAATHIVWYLWTGDNQNLIKLMQCLEDIMARGPLDVC